MTPKLLYTIVSSDAAKPGMVHTKTCDNWGDVLVSLDEGNDRRYPLLWVYEDDGGPVVRKIPREDALAAVETLHETRRAEARHEAGLINWHDGRVL